MITIVTVVNYSKSLDFGLLQRPQCGLKRRSGNDKTNKRFIFLENEPFILRQLILLNFFIWEELINSFNY